MEFDRLIITNSIKCRLTHKNIHFNSILHRHKSDVQHKLLTSHNTEACNTRISKMTLFKMQQDTTKYKLISALTISDHNLIIIFSNTQPCEKKY